MSDLIHQPTQTMKNGSLETKGKPGRPKKIIEEVRDFDEVPIDPKKAATAEDIESTYPDPEKIINFGLGVVKTYEEFYRALDAARMRDEDHFEDERFIELTPEMFKMVTKNQAGCEVMIHGDPAVWVYVVGSRALIRKNHKRKADDVPFKE